MENISEIQSWWPLISSTILFVAWCARLETKVMFLERYRDEAKKSEEIKNKLLWDKLDVIQATTIKLLEAVAKLEAQVENIKDN